MVAVVARDLRVGRVLLAGDRDGRPDLVEVGKQLLRSGALGAVAGRLEGLWARPVEDCVSVAGVDIIWSGIGLRGCWLVRWLSRGRTHRGGMTTCLCIHEYTRIHVVFSHGRDTVLIHCIESPPSAPRTYSHSGYEVVRLVKCFQAISWRPLGSNGRPRTGLGTSGVEKPSPRGTIHI